MALLAEMNKRPAGITAAVAMRRLQEATSRSRSHYQTLAEYRRAVQRELDRSR